MKNLILIMVIAFTGLTMQTMAQKNETKTVCFKSDMTCSGCKNTLTEYLKFEKGVKDLDVDNVSNTIKIVYKTDKNSDESLAKAVEKKGYKAEKITEEEFKTLRAKTVKKP